MKLTHAQKVLILVSLPLLVQLGLLGGLAFLFNQAEQERAREAHAMMVTRQLNDLLRMMLERMSSNMLRHMTGSEEYGKVFKTAATTMEAQLAELKRLTSDDPREREAMQQLTKVCMDVNESYQRVRYAMDHDDTLMALQGWKDVRKNLKKVYVLVDETLAYQVAIQRKQAEQQAGTRKVFESLFIFGAFGIVAMTIVLSLIFNRETTERLNLLRQNTVRLASNQDLLPPLSGADEMAELDRFFRSMAASLAESRRKETAILENAVEVICSIDETGKFSAVNSASASVWGYEPDELIGKRLNSMMPPEESERITGIISGIIRDKSQRKFECRVLKRDGAETEMQFSALWSDEQRSLFCVAHDVSERKKLERLRRDFVAMISHDLKTPLTSIQMFHSLLAADAFGTLNEEGHDCLETAEENVARLLAMVKDLLDIERIESGELNLQARLAPLMPVVEASIDSVKPIAQKRNINLEIAPDASEELSVVMDRDRIAQVLINLLSNAIKYSEDGQTVTLSMVPAAEHVEISVTDKGKGVPEELQKEIFERFKQANVVEDRKKGGTGLGLAICKAIVERHGGQIGVESRVGEGSRFWFRLPADVAT